MYGFEEVLAKDITNVIIGKVNYEYLTNSIKAVGIGVSDKIKRILDKKIKNEKYVKSNENYIKKSIIYNGGRKWIQLSVFTRDEV